jgi:hypothetical protein
MLLPVHRRLGLAALDLDPARPPTCLLVLGICTYYSIVLFCFAISFIDDIILLLDNTTTFISRTVPLLSMDAESATLVIHDAMMPGILRFSSRFSML